VLPPRRYGTIVSHNVPPYGRAGLYKQLTQLKDLLAEYREAPPGGPFEGEVHGVGGGAGGIDESHKKAPAGGGSATTS